MAEVVSAPEVVAFRLQAHGLAERSEAEGLLDAAGRCAVQDSPPGSSLLALHARVRDLTRARLTAAIADERSLLLTWSLRGAPFCFPTADAAVFTTGVLPPTEKALRHLLPGVVPALDELGMSLTEVVELIRAEIVEVLTGRRLPIGELGAALSERISARLPEQRRDLWQSPGPYAPGQPLGEGVVHFGLRVLTLQGVLCFAPRAGNKAPFVLVDEWLDQPIADAEPELARAELVRRFLRCYGPATRRSFAEWVGVRVGDTEPWWSLVEDELTQVDFSGAAWILSEDLGALRSAQMPQGVRLLPPRDPYTQLRDRATILDPKHHRQVWRTIGEPGTVLADGRIVGIWRPRARGDRLTLSVTAFEPLAQRRRAQIQVEAELVATLRGASTVEVAFEGPEPPPG